MRHRKANAHLNRPTDQRLAMLRELASGVIYNGKIETTVVRCKATRPYLEKLVTKAVRGLRFDEAAAAATNPEDAARLRAQSVHLRRIVRAKLQSPELVKHLFDQVAPHFKTRPGGYTRIVRTGFRRGDGAETAQLSWVES
ncbi:MAG: 50S ribosomal protein L17 [Armatimonadetes bacterium]|nr:50S ribosomal protein L17 [Armatimonadota bacterium]